MAGQAYTASADYFNALHRLEKGQLYAQDMFAPLTEHPRIAECLLYLGILNIDLGEYVTAQRFVIHWSINYRGFLPYATFGTWEKVALAKIRISKIFILCTQ